MARGKGASDQRLLTPLPGNSGETAGLPITPYPHLSMFPFAYLNAVVTGDQKGAPLVTGAARHPPWGPTSKIAAAFKGRLIGS